MAAAEEPGQLRFYMENAFGDKTILLHSIRTEPLSTTTIASRARLDVNARRPQALAPTPMNGRPVHWLPNHVIPAEGFLVLAHKSDAADTLDSDDALAKTNISIVVRDITQAGTGLEFRQRTLDKADRNTTRVADDAVLSTTAFVDIYAFKVPTGQEWMMHGEHEVFVADDTP